MRIEFCSYTLQGVSSVQFAHCGIFEKGILLVYATGLSVVFFFFFFTFILLHCRWGKCRVAAVKRLPILHHSANYTFISLGITGSVMVSLKMEFCSYTLESVNSVANSITAYEESQ